MVEPSIVSFGDVEFTVVRKKLREWLALEDYISDIAEAAEAQDIDGFLNPLYSYVSAAVGLAVDEVETAFAIDVIDCLEVCISTNIPNSKLPVLRGSGKAGKKPVSIPVWEYRGRQWYFWLNTLASAYGWEIDYIAELDVDDAYALYQEIVVDEQLRREWEWGLSEIAYPYDKATKTNKFKEYPRPQWMQGQSQAVFKPAEKVKIRKDFLPVGNVISFNKNDKKTDD